MCGRAVFGPPVFCRRYNGRGHVKVTLGRAPLAYVARLSLTLLAAHTPVGNERHRFVRVSPPQLLCGYTEKQVPQYPST